MRPFFIIFLPYCNTSLVKPRGTPMGPVLELAQDDPILQVCPCPSPWELLHALPAGLHFPTGISSSVFRGACCLSWFLHEPTHPTPFSPTLWEQLSPCCSSGLHFHMAASQESSFPWAFSRGTVPGSPTFLLGSAALLNDRINPLFSPPSQLSLC